MQKGDAYRVPLLFAFLVDVALIYFFAFFVAFLAAFLAGAFLAAFFVAMCLFSLSISNFTLQHAALQLTKI
jgi:hypothetical protein